MDINVVNKHKHTKTDIDLYIGRGSILGNKFTSKPIEKTKASTQCNSREESIEKYKEWLLNELTTNLQVQREMNRIYSMALGKGVNLVCFCKPLLCHGDVIKSIVEKKIMEKLHPSLRENNNESD